MSADQRGPSGRTGELLRALPSVGRVLEMAAAQGLLARYPRALVRDAAREALDELRREILDGREPEVGEEAVLERAVEIVERWLAPRLRRVINATGVVIHTGLGRAPLAPAAIEAIRQTAAGYCNLEVVLETGRRGHRHDLVAELLCRVTGAEAAAVVNNNAGAVLLVLRELAAGRKVIVSRGQLIEIGGAFRLPEIMAQSGCELVEVGTTNRTRLDDYERAIDQEAAAILVAHHSNYRIVGFFEEPELAQLADLAHSAGLVLIHDLGSGALVDMRRLGAAKEPTAQESLAAGADVVCFSGDKLLGGPQAGIILGRKELIERIRRNPLARALRVDKLCLAALEATLQLYLDPERALSEVPVLRAIGEPLENVRRRAVRVLEALRAGVPAGVHVKVEEEAGRAGGGSLPEEDIPSAVVKVWPPEGLGPDEVARRLRLGKPAVFPRVADDAVVLDMRTVREDEVEELVQAVLAALGPTAEPEVGQ